MNYPQWIYATQPWLAFIVVFLMLFCFSYGGYRLGLWVTEREPLNRSPYLTDFIPSTVLGLLALILGFTFSMAIERFEHRRQLVIAEAISIDDAHTHAQLIPDPDGKIVQNLIRRYLDARIEHYEIDFGVNDAAHRQIAEIEGQIWAAVRKITRTNRSAVENTLAVMLNDMSDRRIERSIALTKTLPPMVYWSILLISGAGLMSFNFARAERRERGQWQPGILVFMLAFVFYLILDIDRPREGAIRISQDAMTELQKSLAEHSAD